MFSEAPEYFSMRPERMAENIKDNQIILLIRGKKDQKLHYFTLMLYVNLKNMH